MARNNNIVIWIIGIVVAIIIFTQFTSTESVVKFRITESGLVIVGPQGQMITGIDTFPMTTLTLDDRINLEVEFENTNNEEILGVGCDLAIIDSRCFGGGKSFQDMILDCNDDNQLYYEDEQHDFSNLDPGEINYVDFGQIFITEFDHINNACDSTMALIVECTYEEMFSGDIYTDAYFVSEGFELNCQTCEPDGAYHCYDLSGQHWNGDVWSYDSCSQRDYLYQSCGSNICVDDPPSNAHCEAPSFSEGDLIQTC